MSILFLTNLAAGFLGTLACCRTQQVVWKFVRLVAILATALLALALSIHVITIGLPTSIGWLAAALMIGAGICAFIIMGFAPLAGSLGRAVRTAAGAGSVMAWIAACIWAAGQADLTPTGILALALSAALCGTVSLAMLLGHAYLTNTTMTIAPLRRFARLLAGAMIARVLWSSIGTLVLLIGAMAHGRLRPDWAQTYFLFLAVRYGVGLVLPAIFAYMVLVTVKLRATQSATGILYFMLVLVYLGELTALYLTRESGVAF